MSAGSWGSVLGEEFHSGDGGGGFVGGGLITYFSSTVNDRASTPALLLLSAVEEVRPNIESRSVAKLWAMVLIGRGREGEEGEGCCCCCCCSVYCWEEVGSWTTTAGPLLLLMSAGYC